MEIITKTLDELIDIPPNHFIFDIETTGLNSKYCKVILIGILFNEDNKTIIKINSHVKGATRWPGSFYMEKRG